MRVRERGNYFFFEKERGQGEKERNV